MTDLVKIAKRSPYPEALFVSERGAVSIDWRAVRTLALKASDNERSFFVALLAVHDGTYTNQECPSGPFDDTQAALASAVRGWQYAYDVKPSEVVERLHHVIALLRPRTQPKMDASSWQGDSSKRFFEPK